MLLGWKVASWLRWVSLGVFSVQVDDDWRVVVTMGSVKGGVGLDRGRKRMMMDKFVGWGPLCFHKK